MPAISNAHAAQLPSVNPGLWRHRLVWTLQILLALVFLAHGAMMVFPPAEVAQQMNATLPRWFQLFIGIAEMLATVGLTLPALTGIQPWLVAWAAGGLMIVMVSATVFHLTRGEFSSAAVTVVLLAMATEVARARRAQAPLP
jgi:putative oxidoreductase